MLSSIPPSSSTSPPSTVLPEVLSPDQPVSRSYYSFKRLLPGRVWGTGGRGIYREYGRERKVGPLYPLYPRIAHTLPHTPSPYRGNHHQEGTIRRSGPEGTRGSTPGGSGNDWTGRGTGGNRLLYYRSYYPGILLVLPCQLTDPTPLHTPRTYRYSRVFRGSHSYLLVLGE